MEISIDKQHIEPVVRSVVLCSLANQKERYVPAAISNRHVHLSSEHIAALFGNGFEHTIQKQLSQPGQYACVETVHLKGSKGAGLNVRVLGPARKETQVEISLTDAYTLGIPPVFRLSGDLAGSQGCTLAGPNGEVHLQTGVIVALRHLHMSAEQAAAYGLKNGEIVRLKKQGIRGVILDQVQVRSGDGHDLELHIDTDEANAADIHNGDYLEIV
ncbi:MAG: phosphate propanoyltransferase [Eubacteriales bacterium]